MFAVFSPKNVYHEPVEAVFLWLRKTIVKI